MHWKRPFQLNAKQTTHDRLKALTLDANMGKRRRPLPIKGQSKLQFGGKQAELPLEDVLKIGDKFFSNIFSDAESGV